MEKRSETEILNSSLRKYNSYRRAFLKGLFGGLGSAIGATIVFAVLIAILSHTVHSVGDIPILNKIIPATQIQQVLPDQMLLR